MRESSYPTLVHEPPEKSDATPPSSPEVGTIGHQRSPGKLRPLTQIRYESSILVTPYMSWPNRNSLGLFTGGHVFDPHTRHSYYYYTTDRNMSLSGDKRNATVGLWLHIIESKTLYQLEVKPGCLNCWFRSYSASK